VVRGQRGAEARGESSASSGTRVRVRSIWSSQPDESMEAMLAVGFRMFREEYISRVTLHRPDLVRAHASDTHLFHQLDNEWRLLPGPEPNTTWLEFRVDFAFKSSLYAQASSMFMDEVAKRMVSAFDTRCRALYGPRTERHRVEQDAGTETERRPSDQLFAISPRLRLATPLNRHKLVQKPSPLPDKGRSLW
jgi:coenzyme Q-binding protein COQ10